MPATKINYIVIYDGNSQVFGTAKKETAFSSPPPPGCDIDGKRIFFIAMEPDNEVLAVYQVPKQEVIDEYKRAELLKLQAEVEAQDAKMKELEDA